MTYLILAATIIFTVLAQLLFKKGMMILGELDFSLANILSVIPNIFKNAYLLLGTIFFGIAFLLWFFVLSKLKLNIAYPISTSVNLGLVALGSWLFFRESLSLLQIFGVVLIVSGIFLIFAKS